MAGGCPGSRAPASLPTWFCSLWWRSCCPLVPAHGGGVVRGFGNAQTHLCVAGALGPGVPHIINSKLLKHFTCLTYNNGRSVLDFWGLTSGASACRGESRLKGLGRGTRACIGFLATDTAEGSTHGHLPGPGVKVVEETLHITCFVPPWRSSREQL